MPTLAYLTGFNHRVLALDGTAIGTTSGVSIENSFAGALAAPRSGGSALKITTATATAGWDMVIGAVAHLVGVFYVGFDALPNSATQIFAISDSASPVNGVGVYFDQVAGRLAPFTLLANNLVEGATIAVPIVTGAWYRVEFHLDATANPWKWDIRVAKGDAAATASIQQTVALAANPAGQHLQFGGVAAVSSAVNQTDYFTDFAYSTQSADYPLGPLTVKGYSPNANGTHNLDAATSQFFFTDTAAPGVSAALTTSETTSYQNIDDVPLDTDRAAVKVAPRTTFNTISRPGTATSAAATSVAIPTHATGDLILMHVWRNASSTAPTVPAGWNVLGTSSQTGGTKCWAGLYYKIAASGAETSGTWTSATALECEVFRNAQTPVAGDVTVATGVSTSLTYSARTISDTAHSWLSGFSAAASSGCNSTPTGLSISTGFSEVATRGIYSSNGVQGSNFAQATVAVASEAWGTSMIEVKASTTVTQPTNTWYAEYQFAQEAIIASNPYAVRALVALALDSASSSTWAAKLSDPQTTNVEDIFNSSISATARAFQGKVFTQRPTSGGVWTRAALAIQRLRFGFTAAATGTPRLEGAMIEVAYQAPLATLRNPAINHQNPALL